MESFIRLIAKSTIDPFSVPRSTKVPPNASIASGAIEENDQVAFSRPSKQWGDRSASFHIQ